jgi:hypothetical protein
MEGFMSKRISESFAAEEPLGDGPLSPKQLHLLRTLADAIFAELAADAAARQENDELVATFAALFFPGLPKEQARSQLAVMVTTLLAEAEERGRLRGGSNSQLEELVAEIRAQRPDIPEEEIREQLIAFGA